MIMKSRAKEANHQLSILSRSLSEIFMEILLKTEIMSPSLRKIPASN